jgi:hypothetical protein
VAYERDSSPGHQEIVLATRGIIGAFSHETLFEIERTDPLDVVLHVEDGLLWMDWKASANEMAYSKKIGGVWTQPTAVPWEDQSWAGAEAARRLIRGLVLAR